MLEDSTKLADMRYFLADAARRSRLCLAGKGRMSQPCHLPGPMTRVQHRNQKYGAAGMLAMSWYVSYRNGGSVVMNVFKYKELAIGAARRLLDAGCDDGLEVGPMLESLEGNILKAEDLRRIDQNE
jgi:hypothetical protein